MTDATELHEHRLKRLKMRSMRRGIKEMDILLTAYADANLPAMDAAKLGGVGFDIRLHLLHENDQDLYQWVTGQVATPSPYESLIEEVAQTHQNK